MVFIRDSSYGMSCGLTGILMTASLIHRYSGIEMWRQMCQDILTYFTQHDPMPKNPDIIFGPAALLKLLCLNKELREYPGAEAVMHKAADQLLAMRQESPRLWLTIDKKRYLSGAAHGQSGIGTALALAGSFLDRQDLAEAADDALHYEAKLYSPKLKGWPDLRRIALPDSSMHGYCSGAPGIGMNALQRGTEDPYGLLPLAIDSCLHHKLLPLDHFCCGNSAAVDFLLEAGRKLNDQSLIIKSRDILSAFSSRADQNGGYQFSDKNHRPVGIPTLFFGNAGVGYVLLRQIDEDLVTLML
ncbi:MAG: lanthionine synthetase LanC family protein [Eubacteriales bacterium]|nr:lanthionine synthetase LanC family protein [Eubacteriales bacterium]